MAIFINFEEEIHEQPEPVAQKSIPAYNEHLDKSIDELELSVRSYNCLKNSDIKTIRDLVQKKESEMLKTKNFGRKSLNEIKDILAEMGLSLGMKLDGFVPPAQPPKPADSDVDENRILNDRAKGDFDETDDIED